MRQAGRNCGRSAESEGVELSLHQPNECQRVQKRSTGVATDYPWTPSYGSGRCKDLRRTAATCSMGEDACPTLVFFLWMPVGSHP